MRAYCSWYTLHAITQEKVVYVSHTLRVPLTLADQLDRFRDLDLTEMILALLASVITRGINVTIKLCAGERQNVMYTALAEYESACLATTSSSIPSPPDTRPL